MTKKDICILLTVFCLFLGTAYADELPFRLKDIPKLDKPPCEINVTKPNYNQQWCYLNRQCTVTWDTSNIQHASAVFISLVMYSKEGIWEGETLNISNTGIYEWIVTGTPLTTGDPSAAYRIKIHTIDGCVGMSHLFGVKEPPVMPKDKLIPKDNLQKR